MEFVSLLIVLAITCDQGAARPADSGSSFITKNSLASSEEMSGLGEEISYRIPTTIKKGFVITIKGTINTSDKTFTVVLPSISGQQNCQMKFDFADETINITPAVPGYDTAPYNLNFSSGSGEAPTFTLRFIARVLTDGTQVLGMTFNGNEDGESPQLLCKIKKFDDIDKIVIKEGVSHVDSLLFEFE